MSPHPGPMSGLGDILPADFHAKFSEASARVLACPGPVRVLSHYDADGLCAAAIICAALSREGIPFHASILRNFKAADVDRLAKEDFALFVFSDMGSGQTDWMAPIKGRCVILDHHTPREAAEGFVEVNPHRYKVNGTKECCASILAFMLAVEMNCANWDLAPIAVAGALGDKQNLNTGFIGINRTIVSMAAEGGIIQVREGLPLGGSTVLDAVTNSTYPYLTGLAGDDEAARDWATNFHLAAESGVSGLDDALRQRLASAVTLKLLSQGARAEAINNVFLPRYFRAKDGRDLLEFAEEIDTLGRDDLTGMGIAWALGAAAYAPDAARHRRAQTARIINRMRELEKGPPRTMQSIHIVEVETDALAGILAGISVAFVFPQDKPTIAISRVGDVVKASGRGTEHLLRHGLNLAAALKKAAGECDGDGGGHDIAAGAHVPIQRQEEFLQKLDALVAWQLGVGA